MYEKGSDDAKANAFEAREIDGVLAEVIEKANDTEYGLGAAVFTKDIVRGHRVAGEIQAGMVWVSIVFGLQSERS